MNKMHIAKPLPCDPDQEYECWLTWVMRTDGSAYLQAISSTAAGAKRYRDYFDLDDDVIRVYTERALINHGFGESINVTKKYPQDVKKMTGMDIP